MNNDEELNTAGLTSILLTLYFCLFLINLFFDVSMNYSNLVKALLTYALLSGTF